MPRARRDADDALIVRRATMRDIPRVAQWNRELIEDERHDSAATVEVLAGRMRTWLAEDYQICVFEEKGAPAGYALFRELPEWLHLRHFFVARTHRRQGVGRRAFAKLAAAFFPQGKRVLVEVLVGNRAAVAFWSAIGFSERYVGMQYPASNS
ncbi:MAG: GNAT family N-acetyltransferase [Burkholderiales bacterium]